MHGLSVLEALVQAQVVWDQEEWGLVASAQVVLGQVVLGQVELLRAAELVRMLPPLLARSTARCHPTGRYQLIGILILLRLFTDPNLGWPRQLVEGFSRFTRILTRIY